MIRSIIIDDEKPAREVIKNYLAEYCPDVEVAAMADSAKSALAAIHLHHPDLIFLDIEMPNESGFDLLRQLNRIYFKIIFVTAFSEYAVKAFRFSATDYLVKPVSIRELIDAVGKVRQEMARDSTHINIDELMRITKSPGTRIDTLVIPDTDGFKVLKLTDIIRCEADGYCTTFYLSDKKKLTSSRNLKYYEDLLADHSFLRVHNSHLINLHHVKSYSHEGVITLSFNETAPLGNTYKKRFMEWFGRK